MKKIISIILMLFCLNSAYSHNTEVFYDKNVITLSDNRNYFFKPVDKKLSDYLKLTPKEKNDLFDIHESFNKKMLKASLMTDDVKKSDEIYKAINFELNNARSILDSVKYEKFIKIFTITLNNRKFFENISLKNV
jgi:hypothetical protein